MSFPLATSHRIDEVGPGLLRKDLRAEALIGDARSKPAFAHDPRREPVVYRQLLMPAAVGPRCVDSGEDWLVLERIEAEPLWQSGEASTWVAVAAWMAGMHRRLAAGDARGLPLLVHDAGWFRTWRHRAARAGVPASVLACHEGAEARLTALAPTFLHGDLYASNVLVRRGGSPPSVEVWPVDWELAGLGPAVLDVAALSSGSGWPTATRQAMARAYYDAAHGADSGSGTTHDLAPSWGVWSTDLDAARLHLCVQWLGWAPRWRPPPEHRHDWLGEAVALAADLGGRL